MHSTRSRRGIGLTRAKVTGGMPSSVLAWKTTRFMELKCVLGLLLLAATRGTTPRPGSRQRGSSPPVVVSAFLTSSVGTIAGRTAEGRGFCSGGSGCRGGGVGERLGHIRPGVFRRKSAVGGLGMLLKFKQRKERNVMGDLFVDESCVDCDICRWMDPRTFERSGLGSIVKSQPKQEEDRLKTFQAMLACPTGSIRTMRPDMLVAKAMEGFPLALDEERLPGIYQLAPTTRESLGNTPYLIVRPDKRNIMIDVPRYLHRTADRIEALGGVKYLIVTARDNAIGHEPWKKRFPDMIRVLHRTDLARKTRVMEERLDGDGPWYLVKKGRESEVNGWVTGATARFDFVDPQSTKRRAPKDKTVKIVGAPGVTRGSVVVIYDLERADGTGDKVAFSGGTVGFSSHLKRLDTFPRLNEGSTSEQANSVRRLAKEAVTTLLPGRGARVFFDSAEESKEALENAAKRISSVRDLSTHSMVLNARTF